MKDQLYGTQHAHRVVIEKNTSTEDKCNKDTCRGKTQSTENSVKITGLHKHYKRILQNGHIGCC